MLAAGGAGSDVDRHVAYVPELTARTKRAVISARRPVKRVLKSPGSKGARERALIRRILASAALAGVAVTTAVLPADAAAAVGWHQRTCAAFRAWDRHRTAGNLRVMVADSFHVAPRWLGGDVAELYADAERGRVKYLGDDATYVNQDCGG